MKQILIVAGLFLMSCTAYCETVATVPDEVIVIVESESYEVNSVLDLSPVVVYYELRSSDFTASLPLSVTCEPNAYRMVRVVAPVTFNVLGYFPRARSNCRTA